MRLGSLRFIFKEQSVFRINLFNRVLLLLLAFLLLGSSQLFAQAAEREILMADNAGDLGEIAVLEAEAGDANSIAFDPNGTRIAVAYEDGSIGLWDTASFEDPTILPAQEAGKAAFYVTFASPETLIAMVLQGDVGRSIHTWDLETEESTPVEPDFGDAAGLNRTMALSPDGERIVLDSCNGNITFGSGGMTCSPIMLVQFDAATGEVLPESAFVSETRVWSIAYSPDGKWIAAVTSDGFIRILDASTLEEQWMWESDTSQVIGITFSPDSTVVAAGVGDGTIRLFDVETGDEAGVLDAGGDPIIDVAFSPDGTLLASAGVAGTVKLWNVEAQEELASLEGHTDLVIDVAFSADGTLLASGGADDTVRVWGIP
jgi:WD40 repeat protein